MSVITFILILVIVYFVLWPIIRVWLAVHDAQKKARSIFGDQRADGGQRRRGQYEPQPRRHKKKIDRDVGEYVEFEDIKTYSSTTTETADTVETRQYETEEQIVDAEWEDIK